MIRIGEQFYTMSLRMMKAVWWVARDDCLLICVFWLRTGWQAERASTQGLRESGEGAVRGGEAPDPDAALCREDAHAVSLQCAC